MIKNENSMENTNQKSRLRTYFEVGDIFRYFTRVFKKQETTNFNLKMMHGINKISIIMFLCAIIIWTVKRFI
jgi:hypothetical protein